MATRKAISKKVRFEVFKRDKFSCQYCGKSAPDTVLVIDHIKPVSKDGDSEISNLITACFDCNSGKSDRELSDDTAIKKRKLMLDQLQERREQIEMMLDWQRGLDTIKKQELNAAIDYYNNKAVDYRLNENGVKKISPVIRKYGLQEYFECTNISFDQYSEFDTDNKLTPNSVEKILNFIPKIAASRKKMTEKPYLSDLYYIRGILRKRFRYVGYEVMKILEDAYLAGIDFEELKTLSIECGSWSAWVRQMEEETSKWVG